MTAAPLRRSAVAALAVIATAIAPVAVSLIAPTEAAAATAPQLVPAKSAPLPNGTLVQSEDVISVFDQQVTGGVGQSDGTCSDVTKCALVLYEINADGSRGLRVPGNVSFTTSDKLPGGRRNPNGTKDSADFAPRFSLRNGNVYEAIVHVFGVDSNGKPTLPASADYKVYVNSAAPSQLTAPPYANTNNMTALPLSGVAPAGVDVHVDVVDPDDPSTSGFADATADVSVPVCTTGVLCPWSAQVDVSKFTGPHYPKIDWTAQTEDAQDHNNTGDSAAGPSFGWDNTTVDQPSSSTVGPSIVTLSVNVAVTGPSGATGYQITITDVAGNKVQNVYPANPAGSLPTTAVDVSTLDDGTLTVNIQAMNQYGSTSKTGCMLPTPPTGTCAAKQTVNKNVGLQPNFGTSLLSTGGGDVTFTNAQTESIASPTKVTLSFTQTIKQTFSNCCSTNGPTSSDSFLCVATPNGNCVDGGKPTISSDNRSLIWKMAHTLANGTYTVQAVTYSASNCPDVTPATADPKHPNDPPCEKFSDTVRIPGTAAPGTPFTFTVDNSPPTVTIAAVTNPITAGNEKNVQAFGGVAKSASTVQVLYTSAGTSPTKLLVNATIAQPSDPNATTVQWNAGPSDLSSFPDGNVTVKVTAKTSSGLRSSASKTVKMQAHLTTLSEFTDHTTVTANHAIHISGHLSDENGDPIANASISVRPRFTNGKLGHAATAVTNSSGAYTATFVPKFTARYVATYAGAPQHDGAQVKTARTAVRAAVSLSGKSGQSSPVTVTGHVSPSKSGKIVTIFKKTASGWVVAGKARLNSSSRFTAKLALIPGKNQLYASIAKTSGNLAGKSGVLVITVR